MWSAEVSTSTAQKLTLETGLFIISEVLSIKPPEMLENKTI
jgi:hypothetical protein